MISGLCTRNPIAEFTIIWAIPLASYQVYNEQRVYSILLLLLTFSLFLFPFPFNFIIIFCPTGLAFSSLFVGRLTAETHRKY